MSADDAPITDPVPADASADPTRPRSHGLPEDDSATASGTRTRRTAAYCSMQRTMDELST
ncbi:hypothetical protein [Salinigranum marinum]|uniref:hypothetical protein n=1 Tax=Salinigranum marinum TaxID=1515595 RepID=UPI002989FA99|nr:hypothetical protein [Salinigranum marinum]